VKITGSRNERNLNKLVKDIKESNPCVDCKKFYPYYVMDWDHLPEFEKVANINKLIWCASKEKVLAEIAKSELVCSNCHRERTHTRRNG